MELPRLKATPYTGQVYRNIFTCSPSQYLLDDVCAVKDYDLVDAFIQNTSGIDHNEPQVNRPFQYGNIESEEILAVFKRENWGYGRFGDGKSYGVWYGAEEEATSVCEASWTAYRLAQDNMKGHGEVYTTDRAMYQARLSSELAVDITTSRKYAKPLRHPTDYAFCQALGQEMNAVGHEILRTHSARKTDGICTPVFAPQAIKQVTRSYDLKINVSPDGFIGISSAHEAMNFSLSAEQLRDPYGLR